MLDFAIETRGVDPEHWIWIRIQEIARIWIRIQEIARIWIRIQVQKSQIEVHMSSKKIFFFQFLTKILKIDAEQEGVGANLKNFVTFCWKFMHFLLKSTIFTKVLYPWIRIQIHIRIRIRIQGPQMNPDPHPCSYLSLFNYLYLSIIKYLPSYLILARMWFGDAGLVWRRKLEIFRELERWTSIGSEYQT